MPRRFQFGVRALLILVALAAVLSVIARWYIEPYRQQQQTMRLIEKVGGSYKTAEAPTWIRRIAGPHVQNVVLVNLADCDEPAAYLERIAALPALETLAVGGLTFTDEHLATLRRLSTLRHLVLDSTSVTDAGVAALSRALPQVEVCQSQRRAIAALRGVAFDVWVLPTAPYPHVRQLLGDEFCDETKTTTLGVRVRDTDMPYLGLLITVSVIDFGKSQVTDAGLRHVRNLAKVRVLWLEDAEITDVGLEHVSVLSNLERLDLSGTRISDHGLAYLKGLNKLERLQLLRTNVTEAAVDDLRRALPKCAISL